MDDRKLEVLRAIVEDFVRTNVPVGSKHLVEHHRLGVSPATVRNDMSALEEEGYIVQPHTSAGRVPTPKGYRLFVDKLSSLKPLSGAERRAIERFLEGAVDLDDVISRTVRLLSQLTKQVAVVQYPSLVRSAVRHVELVALAPSHLLLVLITDTGRVEQRIVDLPSPVGEDVVADLHNVLNQRLVSRPLTEAPAAIRELPQGMAPELRRVVASVVAVVLQTLVEKPQERVVLGGTSHLTQHAQDFPQTLHPVLEALEEQWVLLRLLGDAPDAEALQVRIGDENPVQGLRSTAVVSIGYGPGTAVASLGVLGPTRMDYAGSMSAVTAVARYVGAYLGAGAGQ
jgi:heat-inducible transcriptional repressor